MRQARDALIGRHHLTLELDAGWLTATWSPMGLFNFPGPFDPEPWCDVLAHLRLLGKELERSERERHAPGFVSPGARSPLA